MTSLSRQEDSVTQPGENAVRRILVVNPNTNRDTTDMMVRRVRVALAAHEVEVTGLTVERGPAMITTEKALIAAASYVVEAVRAEVGAGGVGERPDAIVVAAFGDPGVPELRELPELADVTITGIGEAGLREAAAGDRAFAIATTTGDLAGALAGLVDRAGFTPQYVGLELTETDPVVLSGSPDASRIELAAAVERAQSNGAERVVIGGGPLSDVARDLDTRYPGVIVEPVAAAARSVVGLRSVNPA